METSKRNRIFTGCVFLAVALIMFFLVLLGYYAYLLLSMILIISFVVGFVVAPMFYNESDS